MTHKRNKSNPYFLFPFFAFFFMLGTLLFATTNLITEPQDLRSRADTETTPTEPTPTLAPVGQVLSVDFRLPGIGSQSGNLNPIHKERTLIIYFYSPDKNSLDQSIKPLTSFKTTAVYDSGRFVNSNIDLADKVPDGNYQILIKTNQSIYSLVREKSSDVGGKVFEIKKSFGQKINITNQDILLGDISPLLDGDGRINTEDFDALANCFGSKADTPSCKDKNAADVNDDGSVNGTDYNIMSASLKILTDLGLVVITPTATPAKNTTPKPSKPAQAKPDVEEKSNSSAGLFLVILALFLIAGGVGAFLFIKKMRKSANPEQNVTTGEYFIKSNGYDDINKREILTLTNDNGPIEGYYNGEKVSEGFAQVKGVLKTENGKSYIEVTEITPEKAS